MKPAQRPADATRTVTRTVTLVPDPDYYRGALIDTEGREVLITDDMVLKACRFAGQIRWPFAENDIQYRQPHRLRPRLL